MFGLSSIWTMIQLGVVAIALTAVWSYSSSLAGVQEQLDDTRHKLALVEARERANKNMIERRNEAIDASACKAKIRYWLTHPSEIPTEFPKPLQQNLP